MSKATKSRPRILFVSRAIVVNNGKILLLQRSKDEKYEASKWELPGGKLDKGQDAAFAIEREVIEEASLFVHPINRLVFLDSDIDINTKYKGIPYIRVVGFYKSESSTVKLSPEHDNFRWVPFDRALEMKITDFTRKALLAWEEEVETYMGKF